MNRRAATYVIAEIGVNHDGNLETAHLLIDASAGAGVDAVKFQLFDADLLVARDASKAAYQARATATDESSHEMLRRLQIRREDLLELADHARSLEVELIATPFDLGALAFLVNDLNVPRLKIASGDLTYSQLLLAAARSAKPLILSTGMAALAEVGEALDVVAFGLSEPSGVPPSVDALAGLSATSTGAASLAAAVTVLHCTTAYPTSAADVNLRAMQALAAAFGVPVGYSDHTKGVAVAVAAVALGATIIEKHITLDLSASGPDHSASLTPEEFRRMVQGIREVEVALGSPVKAPVAAEMENIRHARRSVVAARPIDAGQTITLADVDARRPADALSPMLVWDLLDRPAARSYSPGERLEG